MLGDTTNATDQLIDHIKVHDKARRSSLRPSMTE